MPRILGINTPDPKTTAIWLRRFHMMMTVVWAILIVPTVLWWRQSVLWVALMSTWANIMAHFAAYMAGRTEQREIDNAES